MYTNHPINNFANFVIKKTSLKAPYFIFFLSFFSSFFCFLAFFFSFFAFFFAFLAAMASSDSISIMTCLNNNARSSVMWYYTLLANEQQIQFTRKPCPSVSATLCILATVKLRRTDFLEILRPILLTREIALCVNPLVNCNSTYWIEVP